MIFKKKVRAGVLLYALLMAAIFSLLLQFYLQEVLADGREQEAMVQTAKAQLMAEMTREAADKSSGELQYNLGKTQYEVHQKTMRILVTLANGAQRQFTFTYQPKTASTSTTPEPPVSSESSPSRDDQSSETAETTSSSADEKSEVKVQTAQALPTGLVGSWSAEIGGEEVSIAYSQTGTITLQQKGESTTGHLLEYEEISEGLYRVTSPLKDYVAPGQDREEGRIAEGLRLKDNSLTYVYWTGSSVASIEKGEAVLHEDPVSFHRVE